MGPVVWLTKQRVYALPRYAECKAVLRDDQMFISGKGVGLNPLVNRLSRGTTLTSDGDEHDVRRKLVAHRLLPRALRTIEGAVARQADQLVESGVDRRHVDGVKDLATALPLSVVPELVGWPEDGRKNLLRWGQPHSTRWVRSTGMPPRRCQPACRCCASPHRWCAAAR